MSLRTIKPAENKKELYYFFCLHIQRYPHGGIQNKDIKRRRFDPCSTRSRYLTFPHLVQAVTNSIRLLISAIAKTKDRFVMRKRAALKNAPLNSLIFHVLFSYKISYRLRGKECLIMKTIKKIAIAAAVFIAILFCCKKILRVLFPIVVLSKYMSMIAIGCVVGAILYYVLEKRH